MSQSNDPLENNSIPQKPALEATTLEKLLAETHPEKFALTEEDIEWVQCQSVGNEF